MSEIPNPVMRNSDVVSLRDYIDLRFNELQRAVDKAESTMNLRLTGMNEFRDALKDQASRFITRADLGSVEKEIASLRRLADIAEGKASQNSVIGAYAISIIGLIIAIIKAFAK